MARILGWLCATPVIGLSIVSPTFATPYTLESVAPINQFSSPSSVALYSSGAPAICYRNWTVAFGQLDFASKSSGQWVIETLAGTSNMDHPSLQIDAQDHAKVTYGVVDAAGHFLWFAEKDLNWSYQLVDSASHVFPILEADQSLALDATGAPRIAYTRARQESMELWYTSRNAGIWTKEMVATSPTQQLWANPEVSLALNNQGSPRIVYTRVAESAGDINLKFAWKEAGAWTVESVDVAADARVSALPSLALDTLGNPHVAYVEFDQLSEQTYLAYATKSGGSWTVETVGSGPISQGYIYYVSIAVDAQGRVHIAYPDGDGLLERLWLATRTSSGAWLTSTVDPDNISGLGVSLRVDAQGIPRLCYVGRVGGVYYQRYAEANALPNLTPSTPTGWDGPIVPRTSTDATATYAPLPPILDGNAPTTSFNFAALNDGFSTAASSALHLAVDDDVTTWSLPTGAVPQCEFGLVMNTPAGGGPANVRGGRHHVRLTADSRTNTTL